MQFDLNLGKIRTSQQASLPSTQFLKKEGKISIHLGGSVQILFGIKGKRWDGMKEFKKLYNKHWIYPTLEKVYKDVEDGCYW